MEERREIEERRDRNKRKKRETEERRERNRRKRRVKERKKNRRGTGEKENKTERED